MSSSSSIEAFHSWERDESEPVLQTKPWHSDDPVNPEAPHNALACFALLRPLYGVVREHSEEVQPEMSGAYRHCCWRAARRRWQRRRSA